MGDHHRASPHIPGIPRGPLLRAEPGLIMHPGCRQEQGFAPLQNHCTSQRPMHIAVDLVLCPSLHPLEGEGDCSLSAVTASTSWDKVSNPSPSEWEHNQAAGWKGTHYHPCTRGPQCCCHSRGLQPSYPIGAAADGDLVLPLRGHHRRYMRPQNLQIAGDRETELVHPVLGHLGANRGA